MLDRVYFAEVSILSSTTECLRLWEASHSPEAASGASQQAPGTLQHMPMDTSTDLQEFFAETSKNQEKKWKEKCKE